MNYFLHQKLFGVDSEIVLFPLESLEDGGVFGEEESCATVHFLGELRYGERGLVSPSVFCGELLEKKGPIASDLWDS